MHVFTQLATRNPLRPSRVVAYIFSGFGAVAAAR